MRGNHAADKPHRPTLKPHQMTAVSAGLPEALRESIDCDRQKHDPESADRRQAHIEPADAAQHHLAQT